MFYLKKEFLSYGFVQLEDPPSKLIRNCSGTELIATVDAAVAKSSTCIAAPYHPYLLKSNLFDLKAFILLIFN